MAEMDSTGPYVCREQCGDYERELRFQSFRELMLYLASMAKETEEKTALLKLSEK